jgi:hypothetical protein
LSNKVEIYDDSESISVSDIAVYSLDINDITSGGTISIASAVNLLESGGIITSSPVLEEVKTSPETSVKVEVKVDSPNTVNITLAGANVISIADIASLGPQGEKGETGPSGIGVFNDLIGNPFTAIDNKVGLNVDIPLHELQLSGTLFAPVVSGSKMEIEGSGLQDLFIVKLNDSVESKFVINLQGVTILGEFQTTPEPVQGGMFYSASGDFYLGN